MSKQIKSAFLFGLWTFPLTVGVFLGVGGAGARLLGGDLTPDLLGTTLLAIIASVPFMTLFFIVFVWPVYLLIGCPIWMALHKAQIASWIPFSLTAGLLAYAGMLVILVIPFTGWDPETLLEVNAFLSGLFLAIPFAFIARHLWRIAYGAEAGETL